MRELQDPECKILMMLQPSKHYDMNVKSFHPKGPADICWISIEEIITKVEPLSSGTTGCVYCFQFDDRTFAKFII